MSENLINNDVSRCNNHRCNKRANCKRYLQLAVDKTRQNNGQLAIISVCRFVEDQCANYLPLIGKSLIVLLCLCQFAVAQNNRFGVTLVQDGKLLLLGDDHGNSALTPNLMFNIELRGRTNGQDFFKGYGFAMPTLEYAGLAGGNYWRYGVNGGYTFNNWFTIPVDVSFYAGVGAISRHFSQFQGENTFFPSFAVGNTIAFKITPKTSLVLLQQLTDRKDLKMTYNEGRYFMYNLMAGVQFNFN